MSDRAGLDVDDFGFIAVDYSVGDIVALQLAAWRYWLRIAAFPFILFGVLSLLRVLSGEEGLRESIGSSDWSVAAVLSALLTGVLMAAITIGYAIRRLRGRHSNIRLGIGSQGATFRGHDGEGTVFWKSLTRVWANEERLMLFLSSHSALIIPRRYFSDPATYGRWVIFSKARWHEAKNHGK